MLKQVFMLFTGTVALKGGFSGPESFKNGALIVAEGEKEAVAGTLEAFALLVGNFGKAGGSCMRC